MEQGERSGRNWFKNSHWAAFLGFSILSVVPSMGCKKPVAPLPDEHIGFPSQSGIGHLFVVLDRNSTDEDQTIFIGYLPPAPAVQTIWAKFHNGQVERDCCPSNASTFYIEAIIQPSLMKDLSATMPKAFKGDFLQQARNDAGNGQEPVSSVQVVAAFLKSAKVIAVEKASTDDAQQEQAITKLSQLEAVLSWNRFQQPSDLIGDECKEMNHDITANIGQISDRLNAWYTLQRNWDARSR